MLFIFGDVFPRQLKGLRMALVGDWMIELALFGMTPSLVMKDFVI